MLTLPTLCITEKLECFQSSSANKLNRLFHDKEFIADSARSDRWKRPIQLSLNWLLWNQWQTIQPSINIVMHYQPQSLFLFLLSRSWGGVLPDLSLGVAVGRGSSSNLGQEGTSFPHDPSHQRGGASFLPITVHHGIATLPPPCG